jgi:hypothetical protein
VGSARAAVFSLIGSFAESATYVRQRRVASEGDGLATRLQFEGGTGELAPDARFDPHGHVVVINVDGCFRTVGCAAPRSGRPFGAELGAWRARSVVRFLKVSPVRRLAGRAGVG